MKVNTRSFLAFICILFVVTISSCNKCGHKIEKVYRIFNYADYFDYFFKENSVWIYQNTTTLALDTVIVQKAYVTDVYELNDKDECKNIYENKAEMLLHTSYYDTTFIYSIKNLGIGTRPIRIYNDVLYNFVYSSELKNPGENNSGLSYQDYFEEYIIGANTYHKVKKIRCAEPEQFGYDVLYWCPKNGIIRKENDSDTTNTDVWVLIYSDVKQ